MATERQLGEIKLEHYFLTSQQSIYLPSVSRNKNRSNAQIQPIITGNVINFDKPATTSGLHALHRVTNSDNSLLPPTDQSISNAANAGRLMDEKAVI